MDKLVHFEIPVDDLARAQKFYSDIFKWDIKNWGDMNGEPYYGVRTVSVDETTHIPTEPGAINGGMVMRSKQVQHPIFAIEVSSVDEYIKRIEAAGGKVIKPKIEIGGMGYYAYVTDLEGNVLGLWENIKK